MGTPGLVSDNSTAYMGSSSEWSPIVRLTVAARPGSQRHSSFKTAAAAAAISGRLGKPEINFPTNAVVVN